MDAAGADLLAAYGSQVEDVMNPLEPLMICARAAPPSAVSPSRSDPAPADG